RKREKRQDQVIGINRNERSQSPKYAPLDLIRSRSPSPSNKLYSLSLGFADLISLSVSRVVTFAMMGTPN
ncbi:hypothetical protein ABUS74_15945, partial [Vibrio cholerae]